MELVLSVIWLKVYHLMITPITHWHVILLLFLKRDGNIVLLNFLFLSMDRIIFKYKTTIVFLKEMFLLTGDPTLTLIWSKDDIPVICHITVHKISIVKKKKKKKMSRGYSILWYNAFNLKLHNLSSFFFFFYIKLN